MKAILEVWCSPLRGEIYGHSCILKSTASWGFEEDISIYLDSDFFSDVFGEDHETIGGLWKVVFELEIQYSQDYFGEYDADYYIEETPYKSKCNNLTELKNIWLDLNGKSEEYYNKPYKNPWFQFQN